VIYHPTQEPLRNWRKSPFIDRPTYSSAAIAKAADGVNKSRQSAFANSKIGAILDGTLTIADADGQRTTMVRFRKITQNNGANSPVWVIIDGLRELTQVAAQSCHASTLPTQSLHNPIRPHMTEP